MAGRQGGHVCSAAPFQSGGPLRDPLCLSASPRPAIWDRVRLEPASRGGFPGLRPRLNARPCGVRPGKRSTGPFASSGLTLLSAVLRRAAGPPVSGSSTGRCTIVLCLFGPGVRPARSSRVVPAATSWPARIRHLRFMPRRRPGSRFRRPERPRLSQARRKLDRFFGRERGG